MSPSGRLFEYQRQLGRGARLRSQLARVSARKPGWQIVAGACAITILLWVAAKADTTGFGDLWPWRGAAQITIHLSLTLMAVALIAGSRSGMVEPLFGGLDRATRIHRIIGPLAIGLIVVHVMLLMPLWTADGGRIVQLFIPFVWSRTADFDVFIVVTWGFLILGILAYWGALSHERWQAVHAINGVLFIAGMVTTLAIPGSVSGFEPFRLWMGILLFGGSLALIYRLLLFRRYGPGYRYLVARSVERGNRIFDLVMTPAEQRMSYAPGRFVFISVPNSEHLPPEFHPFSLSSSPVKSEMRLSVRAIGDYTQQLVTLPAGHPIDVYGPFGSFSLHSVAAWRRIVCVGAGIGIAPFLGMLAFEVTNDEDREIWLFYVVRDAGDAVYHDELAQTASGAHSSVSYELWNSAERGLITAAHIHQQLHDQDYAVLLCGPPNFISDLTLQFRALGLPPEQILAEGFAFR